MTDEDESATLPEEDLALKHNQIVEKDAASGEEIIVEKLPKPNPETAEQRKAKRYSFIDPDAPPLEDDLGEERESDN